MVPHSPAYLWAEKLGGPSHSISPEGGEIFQQDGHTISSNNSSATSTLGCAFPQPLQLTAAEPQDTVSF